MEMIEQTKEETYASIRGYVINAQRKVYAAVNFAMVNAYWEIGEKIYYACGENERAAYGNQLLEYISEKLTAEFGKGYDISNLRNMRKFYRTFPIRDALRPELSWTHYRALMLDGRHFYIDLVFYNYILKCFVLIDLKVGELTHQDDKSDALVRYTLPENNTQIYAAKYLACMPTEEELCRELKLKEFQKINR